MLVCVYQKQGPNEQTAAVVDAVDERLFSTHSMCFSYKLNI